MKWWKELTLLLPIVCKLHCKFESCLAILTNVIETIRITFAFSKPYQTGVVGSGASLQ